MAACMGCLKPHIQHVHMASVTQCMLVGKLGLPTTFFKSSGSVLAWKWCRFLTRGQSKSDRGQSPKTKIALRKTLLSTALHQRMHALCPARKTLSEYEERTFTRSQKKGPKLTICKESANDSSRVK